MVNFTWLGHLNKDDIINLVKKIYEKDSNVSWDDEKNAINRIQLCQSHNIIEVINDLDDCTKGITKIVLNDFGVSVNGKFVDGEVVDLYYGYLMDKCPEYKDKLINFLNYDATDIDNSLPENIGENMETYLNYALSMYCEPTQSGEEEKI